MARRENEKKKPVNRVRRKADEQDITLGSKSKLPEDTRKSIRKSGNKLETKSTKKVTSSEVDEAKKGRPPKKEVAKVSKDRHAPRKSEIEKQYTKEFQKLRNRLKYREKQGFFIQWETLPARKTGGITEFDINSLKNYQVRLDSEKNEIYLERTMYKSDAREDKLRVPTDLLPSNTFVNNEDDFVPPKSETGEFNVLEVISESLEATLQEVYYQLEGSPDEQLYSTNRSRALNDPDFYVELVMSKVDSVQEAIKIFDSNMQKYDHTLLARYYHNHESQITRLLNDIIRATYVEEVQQINDELIRYLEVH